MVMKGACVEMGGDALLPLPGTWELLLMETTFEGIDGKHSASLLPNGEIRLKLKDVEGIRWMEDGYLLDTGSPHFVKFVCNLDELNVEQEGRKIRNAVQMG